MSPHDAWTLARLLAGQSINGEVEALAWPFGAIARRLAGLPLADRQAPWDGFLDARDDREEIIQAIAATDPAAARPDAVVDVELDDDWGPIRVGTLPSAEPFPLDVLPLQARDLAESAARSIGCPVDFPAVAALAAMSGAIGRSASLLVKSGYFESASLFAALVGDSSDGKSPSLDAAMGPIRSIATRLYDEHKAAVASWARAQEEDRGERPKLKRIETTNPTTEALALILSGNERGMVVLPDEFMGLCLSMGQYKGGKGGDKQFYLSAWSGSRAVPDRVKDLGNPVVVARPFLTLAGGMTPGGLARLASDGSDEDGFMNRVLFAYPEPVRGRRYSEDGIPDGVARDWGRLIDRLYEREMREEGGKLIPHTVMMTAQARSLWATNCQAHLDEQERDDFPRPLKGAWGKLQSYAARLALILACGRQAGDPTVDHLATPTVDALVVHDAWRLVAYFKSHAHRVHASMRGRLADGGVGVRVLTGWITRGSRRVFSTRDVRKDVAMFRDDPAVLEDALKWMVARNLIRPQSEPEGDPPKKGRKPTPKYEVNPTLLDSPQNRQNRQNDLDEGNSVYSVYSDVNPEDES